MTKLLEKAFAEASKLPDEDQNFLAHQLLADIEDEARWNKSFADPRSHKLLEKWAEEVRAEIAAGETEPLEKLLDELEEDDLADDQEFSQAA